jgi:uncharacterized membrane protein
VKHLGGCGRFWLWAVAGALVAFSLIAAASIGLFILPVAGLVTLLAVRRTRSRAEMLGGFVGAGAVCGLIAMLQRGPGSLDARPWIIAAVVLAAVGLVGYAVLERRLAPRA